jgi:hypothetical protein
MLGRTYIGGDVEIRSDTLRKHTSSISCEGMKFGSITLLLAGITREQAPTSRATEIPFRQLTRPLTSPNQASSRDIGSFS